MHLPDAQVELRKRLYRWAQATMTHEVAEDFPVLQACQHNRDLKCFLAWMKNTEEEKRLAICLALIERHKDLHLPATHRSPEAEAVFQQYRTAGSYYHSILLPVPDCDTRAPGFTKADPTRCIEKIVQALVPLCGNPTKCQKHKRKFVRRFDDWSFTTYVQVWVRDESVECHSFLQRDDHERGPSPEEWSSRIDPLMQFGVATNKYILISQPHEERCAKSLRASIETLVIAIPKLIQGLAIND